MSDMKETDTYDQLEDRIITHYTQDVEPILDANREKRNAQPEFGQYKGNLVHALSISETDVIRLKNMGYNLMSPDPEEWKRALLYIQQNEPYHLVVNGKPFAKKKAIWS